MIALPTDIISPAVIGAIVVFLATLSLALLVTTLISRHSERIQARLARHEVGVAAAPIQRTERLQVLARPEGGGPALLAAVQRRLSFLERVRGDLLRANLQLGLGRYLLIRFALAVVLFGIVQLVSGEVLFAVITAVVAFVLPRVIVKRLGARRADAFDKQLAGTLDVIIGSLRAGQGLVQAIDSSASEQPEPMRSELQRIVSQVNMGINIGDAMELLAERFASRDVDLLAAAISINRQTGGNLTEVLQNLAGTVRQRQEIRAEAKALTAAPRATGYVLAFLPLAIAAYTTAVSPIYREQLFHNPLGRILLIGAVIWSLIGFFISQKLAKVEF
jgi:tight adherence protein B